jgi:hypothetical protein
MGAMDVGWSDLGSWTALLAAIADGDAPGASGRVLQTGEVVHPGPDDLVVHAIGGRLVVEAAADLPASADGTIVADGAWAHLVGAQPLEARIRALLDRVDRQEIRA